MQTIPTNSIASIKKIGTPNGAGLSHHIIEKMAADSTVTDNGGDVGQTDRVHIQQISSNAAPIATFRVGINADVTPVRHEDNQSVDTRIVSMR